MSSDSSFTPEPRRPHWNPATGFTSEPPRPPKPPPRPYWQTLLLCLATGVATSATACYCAWRTQVGFGRLAEHRPLLQFLQDPDTTSIKVVCLLTGFLAFFLNHFEERSGLPLRVVVWQHALTVVLAGVTAMLICSVHMLSSH